jgi:hypothetical protein
MPNSLGNTPGTLIAQRALETLLEEFSVIKQVVSDFSTETALLNQQISVKLPSAFGAAPDWSAATGYVAQNANAVDRPLTISRHVHATYGFSDSERSSTSIQLIETFAAAAAQSIGLAVVTDLFKLVNAANFPNSSVATAANFNRAALIAAGKALSTRKVPQGNRFAVIHNDLTPALLADTTVVANPASPSDAVKSGRLGQIHGFEVHEYAQFAAGTGSGGSVNCRGIAASPSALLLATRLPAGPEASDFPGRLEVVTEPKTGLSLQVRTWYNANAGMEYRSYGLMFGVAVGIPDALQRLVITADV